MMQMPPYVKRYNNFDSSKDSVWYSGPYWDEREINSAIKSLTEGLWITSGERVSQFQDEFGVMFNTKYCHMVNSGSSANLVMVAALKKHFKWEDGDEVIVSPVGFPTTIAPLIQNNLTPVFVDIEMQTLNMNSKLIENAITNKTKAIIVSPVLGNPPDMDLLVDICNKHNIILIGDNCDSLGSKYKGKHLNEYYFAWSCSFYPAHHISTGEGGMISCNEEAFIQLVRSISWWGRDCFCVGVNNLLPCGTCGKRFSNWLESYDGVIDHKYVFNNIGYNLKPLDLQGAIGSVQLSKIGEIDSKRRLHKQILTSYLTEFIPTVRVADSLPDSDPSWFGIPIICESQDQKELLVDHFENHRVQTRSYFAGNILLHPGYRHLGDYKKFANSNLALSHVFFIGCTPLYTQPVLDYLKEVIKAW